MNKQRNKTLKYLLSGILLISAAGLQAQTSGNAGDSTMHHRQFRRGDRQNFNRDFNHERGDFQRGDFGHRGFDRGFGHRGFGERGFGHNREHIRFTPEQREQLMVINREYRQKRGDLYKQDNLTLKQYKSGLLALEKEKKAKVQGLLTQQQKDELAANRKNREENHLVREAAYIERLKLHLNLTEDQVAKLKTNNESLRTQAKAIHENDNLLPEQKREQMQALMAKRNDNIKAVLTPDQYTQFQSMMSHRRPGGGAPHGSRAI